ncbi:MAG: septum formation initiator family protein [Proteobacteria bacterium]|nr:septum formation initiator family protein [Pseudomonadota bacterium]MBI3496051.1 septum formation initiator family protein [Pseudomonadota bacterium]
MSIARELRRRARHVVGPVLGILVASYFAYHAVEGDRGLLAWRRMGVEIAEAEARLGVVAKERQTLEHRVSLLRPDNLDPDMLEERARAILNFSRPDEVVILSPRAPARN